MFYIFYKYVKYEAMTGVWIYRQFHIYLITWFLRYSIFVYNTSGVRWLNYLGSTEEHQRYFNSSVEYLPIYGLSQTFKYFRNKSPPHYLKN